MEMEIPLVGGRITDGVVRLADTVRPPEHVIIRNRLGESMSLEG